MEYDYFLIDDGGVCNIDLPILMPVGSTFTHEFGEYKVRNYIDGSTQATDNTSEAKSVECHRIESRKNVDGYYLKRRMIQSWSSDAITINLISDTIKGSSTVLGSISHSKGNGLDYGQAMAIAEAIAERWNKHLDK